MIRQRQRATTTGAEQRAARPGSVNGPGRLAAGAAPALGAGLPIQQTALHGNAALRAATVQRLQLAYGNQAALSYVQRAARGAAPPATTDLAARIRATAGRGSPLEPAVQRRLEGGLGADLSAARLHTDAEADQLARSVDALAFTSGTDIYFRAGAYRPASADGLRLLAHEASHVVQQGAGPVDGTPAPGGVAISDPGDRFERAAEQMAARALAAPAAPGGLLPVARTAARPGGAAIAIQRVLTEPQAATLAREFPAYPALTAYAKANAPTLPAARALAAYVSGANFDPVPVNGLASKSPASYQVFTAARSASLYRLPAATVNRIVADLLAVAANRRGLIADQLKTAMESGRVRDEGVRHVLDSIASSFPSSSVDLAGRIEAAPAADFLLRYQIDERGSDMGYEAVTPAQSVAPTLPTPPTSPADRIGYVVNIATIPSDSTPEKIAAKYQEQGFTDPADCPTRLAMVIGVNKYKSLSGKSEEQVGTHMAKKGTPSYNLRVFGFTWKLNWRKSTTNARDDDADSFAGAQKAFNEQDQASKDAVLAYERASLSQQTIPYGLIREKITTSAQTRELVALLRKYNKHVYIHLGDADAVSLRAPEGRTAAGPLKEGTTPITSLFGRYDKVLGDADHPLMAIGGYEFRLKGTGPDEAINKQKGDLDPGNIEDYLAFLANQLDIAVRMAIASVAPTAVYPTEPNLVFLAAGPTEGGEYNLFETSLFNRDGSLKREGSLYGGGAREGRKLQKNLMKVREREGFSEDENQIVYDPRVSVATGSGRFTLREGDPEGHQKGASTYGEKRRVAYTKGRKLVEPGTNAVKYANRKDAFKARVIEDMIKQTQSFVDPADFAREVGEGVGPISSDKAKGFANRINNRIYKKLLNRQFKASSAVEKVGDSPTDAEQAMEDIVQAVKVKLESAELAWLWTELGRKLDALYTKYGYR